MYAFEMNNITKLFPGVVALDDVTFKVNAGSVHALMGENGAGKSTLMKCLLGIYHPNKGEIKINGNVANIKNPNDATSKGISMIHQELSIVPDRSIMENIWLNREPTNFIGIVNHKKMFNKTKELLTSMGMSDINPKASMRSLTVATAQMIEIIKAISHNVNIIIMDEPTSSLTNKEIDHLFNVIAELKKNGKSVVFISHKMDEVYRVSDEITVLRDGKLEGSYKTKDLNEANLIKKMVGRELTDMYPVKRSKFGEVLLEVKDLSVKNLFEHISFTVRRGEILGIAGLMGSKRTELIETIFGLRAKTSGDVYVQGHKVDITSSVDAIKNHMGFVTEDRAFNGIYPVLGVLINMAIVNLNKYISKIGLLNYDEIKNDVEKYKSKINIKTPTLNTSIRNLSGGNQQKVLIARWLLTTPDILFLDEPTRGIDVGAKSEIYSLIVNLAQEGKAIVMISSELPEILGVSDRILVMHEGKNKGILLTDTATQESILQTAISNIN